MQKISGLMFKIDKILKGQEAYFGLSTALNIISEYTPSQLYVLSVGDKKPALPSIIKHKHVSTFDWGAYTERALFPLDSVLIRIGNGMRLLSKDALIDISKKQISMKSIDLFKDNPCQIIHAAYLIANTKFEPTQDLLNQAIKYAHRLNKFDTEIWKQFTLLLKAAVPSKGIEFLRITGALAAFLPELQSCVGVEQNKKYHKYTVYEHCIKACDAAEPTTVMRTAALLHDIGKPLVAVQRPTGVTFYKHEVEGTKIVENIMSRLNVSTATAKQIIELVSLHMYKYDRIWKDSTVLRFAKKAGITKEYIGRMKDVPVFKLRGYDRIGRDLPAVTQKQLDLENRIEKLLSEQ